MTQEEKLEMLKGWLAENGTAILAKDGGEDRYDRVFIGSPRKIVVFVCPKDDERKCFEVSCAIKHKAFFIRESDSMGFILEKMRHCLDGWTVAKADKERKKAAPAKAVAAKPHKRQRIHKVTYEKVERR